jgi:hypothetical protein
MRRTVLILLVAVLAGCGSSGSSAPSTTTAAPAVDTKADQALADNLVATRDDLPAGWKEEADDTPDSGCFTTPLGAAVTPTGRAHGKSVQSEGFGFVHSYARVYATTADAEKAFAAASSPDRFRCQLETARSRAAKQTDPKLADAVITPLDATGVGDQAAASQVELKFNGGGSPYSAYGDWWVIRRGRAVVVMVFAELGQAFDATVRGDTLEKLLTRSPNGV